MRLSKGIDRFQLRLDAVRALWEQERTLAGPDLPVAGVDEAGRGCLAGPVFAAAVVPGGAPEDWAGIHDSKRLSRSERERMYQFILERAHMVSVAYASVDEIDRMNILQAARLAMGRAIRGLGGGERIVLVDGPYEPLFDVPWPVQVRPVVDGDATCLSVAAASIVAKVVRDRYMEKLAEAYPQYGFDHHAGYATPEHLHAISVYGVSPHHRRSFAPVRKRLEGERSTSIQSALAL